MALQISQDEMLDILHRIERREIVLTPLKDPQDVYAGNVDYTASNGWKLTVFNDCNDWDYLDRIEAPDGRVVDFDEMWDEAPRVSGYLPPEGMDWARYKIPGYLTFRCRKCEALLKLLGPLCDKCVVEGL